MSGGILESIPLDRTSAWWGIPLIATGRQPRFPEGTESLVQKLPPGYLEPLVRKLNKIFKDRGCPLFPLVLLWLVLFASLVLSFENYIGEDGQLVFKLCGSLCGLLFSVINFICHTKRRRSVSSALGKWNRSDGQSYGVQVDITDQGGNGLTLCWSKKVFLHVYDGSSCMCGSCDLSNMSCCFPL